MISSETTPAQVNVKFCFDDVHADVTKHLDVTRNGTVVRGKVDGDGYVISS